MIDPELQEQMFTAAKDAGEDAGFELISVVIEGDAITYRWGHIRLPYKYQHAVPIVRINQSTAPDLAISHTFWKCSEAMQDAIRAHS